MRIILSILLFITLSSRGYSTNQANNEHDKRVTSGIVTKNVINVDTIGMVCDFCAQAIEKVFLKQKEVKGINVELEHQKVIIYIEENTTLDDNLIVQLFENSGYGIDKINRSSR